MEWGGIYEVSWRNLLIFIFLDLLQYLIGSINKLCLPHSIACLSLAESFWSFAMCRVFWCASYFSFSLPEVGDGNRHSKLSKFYRILHCTQSEVNSFEAFPPKHRTISLVCWKSFAVFEFLPMLPDHFLSLLSVFWTENAPFFHQASVLRRCQMMLQQ